jgi:hypothetical protein
MPYQPVRRTNMAHWLPPQEWELLVRLPGRVLVAATSAGRASPSRLVRDVVTAIYAERDRDAPVAEEFVDARAGIAGVLAECRAAAQTLADRVPAPDAAAYRAWLAAIAGTVCAAARSGGLFGLGGEPVSEAEQRFLDELAAALVG